LRFQALKADDQEAYMKMVEESKNERLTMLLGKTNDLLVRLGAAVQRQKDAEHDGIEPLESSDADLPELSRSKAGTPAQSLPKEDEDVVDNEPNRQVKTGDFLEGQRQYDSVVHSIQEKVIVMWLSFCFPGLSFLFVCAFCLSWMLEVIYVQYWLFF
jgi:hypothetical protein